MTDIKRIINDIKLKSGKEIQDNLNNYYKNLFIKLSNNGYIWTWINVEDCAREGIEDDSVNVYTDDWKSFLDELNKTAEIVHLEPDKYFYCTECCKVKPMDEFEENVLAGWYCKECAKKPNVANLIKESHKKGFYD